MYAFSWFFLITVFISLTKFSIARHAEHSSSHAKSRRALGNSHSSGFTRRSHHEQEYAESAFVENQLPIIRHQRFTPLDKLICEKLGCKDNSTISELLAVKKASPTQKLKTFDEVGTRSSVEMHREERNEQHDANLNDDHSTYQLPFQSMEEDLLAEDDANKELPVSKTTTVSWTSQKKWDEMGTREKVNKKFQQRYNNKANKHMMTEEAKKAKQHIGQMLNEYICSTPTPIIVRVEDIYPAGPLKKYFPHCVRLHQCGEISGCCSDNAKCLNYTTEKIDLYFEITNYVPDKFKDHRVITYEKLSFINHTSCKCQRPHNGDGMQNDEPVSDDDGRNILTNLPDSANNESNECICARPFTARVGAEGECACDCFDKEHECIKYKKGMGTLHEDDRRCVNESKCAPPTCEYGEYIDDLGRCPRKKSKDYFANRKHH